MRERESERERERERDRDREGEKERERDRPAQLLPCRILYAAIPPDGHSGLYQFTQND